MQPYGLFDTRVCSPLARCRGTSFFVSRFVPNGRKEGS
jgi:hypothetical protein